MQVKKAPPTVLVVPHALVRGKIWLLTSANLERLEDGTKLVDIRGNPVVVGSKLDYIDNLDDRMHGYLAYGLPCHTWDLTSAWNLLNKAPSKTFWDIFSRKIKQDTRTTTPRLARWTLASGSEAGYFEYCEPLVPGESKEENKT